MMDRELLYNQAGIKDITAYKAITNLLNEEEKSMGGCEINKGDIWEVESGTGTRLAVVVAVHERYAATIMLADEEPEGNAVQIKARGIMYADAGRLGFVFYNKMVDYVRTLTEDEDATLRQAIAAALDIPMDEYAYESVAADADREIESRDLEITQLRRELKENEEERVALLTELENSQEEAEGLRKQLEDADQEKIKKLAEESVEMLQALAAARREAEVYKGLYEDMLARVLK